MDLPSLFILFFGMSFFFSIITLTWSFDNLFLVLQSQLVMYNCFVAYLYIDWTVSHYIIGVVCCWSSSYLFSSSIIINVDALMETPLRADLLMCICLYKSFDTDIQSWNDLKHKGLARITIRSLVFITLFLCLSLSISLSPSLFLHLSFPLLFVSSLHLHKTY